MKTRLLLGLGLIPVLLAIWRPPFREEPAPQPVTRTSASWSPRRVAPARAEALRPTDRFDAGQLDPHELPGAVEPEDDSDPDGDAIEHTAESVPAVELPATLESLLLIETPAAGELRQILVRRWAELDPAAAAAWAAGLPDGADCQNAMEQIAIAWAESDLAAATTWMEALPEGRNRETAAFALAYETARTDPLAALEFARTLPATSERDELLSHIVSQWADAETGPVVDWAVGIADRLLRERLLSAAIIAVAQRDGLTGATLAASSLSPGEEQDRAAVAIVQRWAQQAPDAASAWVAEFPATPARDAATQCLLSVWVGVNPDAAIRWVESLPSGPRRDARMVFLAEAMAEPPANSTVGSHRQE